MSVDITINLWHLVGKTNDKGIVRVADKMAEKSLDLVVFVHKVLAPLDIQQRTISDTFLQDQSPPPSPLIKYLQLYLLKKIIDGGATYCSFLCARKHVRSVHRTPRVGPLHRASNADEFCI